MAYYADLTQYDYYDFDSPMVNVGWLDPSHPFAVGEVSEEFTRALTLCAVEFEQQMRGFHDCRFCNEESPIYVRRPDGSRYVSLGSAEIHVVGEDGRRFAAPDLIVHYVLAHGYRPPHEFQAAVLFDNATRSRAAFTCPVCGYPELDEPASSSGTLSGERCPSCGVRFNIDLRGASVETLRTAWSDRGSSWSTPWRPAPVGWDPVTQLRAVDNA